MLIAGTQMTAKPGSAGAAGANTVALRDALADATGQPWAAWAAVAGEPYGTYALTTRFEGVADLVAAQLKLPDHAGFQAAAAVNGDVAVGPAEMSLTEVVAVTGSNSGDPAAPKPFLMLTRGQIAAGHVKDAMAWSVQVMEHASAVTASEGLVTLSTVGPMFEVGFAAGFASAADLDAANAALGADATYADMIDAAGELFDNGTARRTIAMQLP